MYISAFHLPLLIFVWTGFLVFLCTSLNESELFGIANTTSNIPKIDPTLLQFFQQNPFSTQPIMVAFTEGTRPVINRFESLPFPSLDDKVNNLVTALNAHSFTFQAPVIDWLNLNGVKHQTLWINNHMSIPKATSQVVSVLAQFPQVKAIKARAIYSIIEPVVRGDVTTSESSCLRNNTVLWGQAAIGATSNCTSLKNPGINIVVATIDTGVRVTHIELRGNFRNILGWYDPQDNTPTPIDDNGHGTHTTGTICGKTVGIAPNATWIACRGCPGASCPDYALLICAQFILCPPFPLGCGMPICNCTGRPHVVSNSWGSLIPGSLPILADNFYYEAIKAWKLANIVPVFAIGNSGPLCLTASPPGSYDNVDLSVGSITKSDPFNVVSYFSSRGPVFVIPSQYNLTNVNQTCFPLCDGWLICVSRIIKPDISAPGDGIYSCFNCSDCCYANLSGTSMATPHVAGVVAIVLSVNPIMGYDKVISIVKDTATFIPPLWFGSVNLSRILAIITHILCNILFGACSPNNLYGCGVVNACLAYQKAQKTANMTEPNEL